MQLGTAIDAIAQRPQFQRARWGILIEPLSSNNPLYSRERSGYFIPASNTKLLTTAAALTKLSPDFRIRTSIYNTSKDPNIKSLRVVGRGDPSLTEAQLLDLAQQLKRQGYTQIQQLVVDDGYFQGAVVDPSWEWEDVQFYYGTAVNSLILNQNAVELTLSPQAVGSPLKLAWGDPVEAIARQVKNDSTTAAAGSERTVEAAGVLGKSTLQITGQIPLDGEPESLSLAVLDPANYFLQHLRLAFSSQQIRVTNARIVSSKENYNQPEVAAVESPPLSELLQEVNQNSNNLYAEVLLKTIGVSDRKTNTAYQKNTVDLGLANLKQTLTQLGVDPQSYILVDGSGLSRHNFISPDALVQTLKAMTRSPHAKIYRESLPLAGISGSLKRRFVNTSAQDIVRAKTGTMTGVVSLSGYVNPPNYQPLVFSIIVNQSNQPAATSRQAIDEIVLLLTRLRRC
ncbi:MAG: D-alanyl-D-alanine carboxypeptidase/D-alanyl-D-alanine-endopeptidase [Cyanosarcina radialis HA8281-LM2]|nr:D-alanyl-D-alanine carboxypeptidase/D-alanyl-D-alanine-endopeptidase [Cyanosarcina radialis HA8281-LM2]